MPKLLRTILDPRKTWPMERCSGQFVFHVLFFGPRTSLRRPTPLCRTPPPRDPPAKIRALHRTPKFRAFFPSPATIFFLSSLSWVSFRGILVVCTGTLKWARLGSRVVTKEKPRKTQEKPRNLNKFKENKEKQRKTKNMTALGRRGFARQPRRLKHQWHVMPDVVIVWAQMSVCVRLQNLTELSLSTTTERKVRKARVRNREVSFVFLGSLPCMRDAVSIIRSV